MDSYCLQQGVSEVFNNQLCMQFTLRLMLREGMSHLQCHNLQMGLPFSIGQLLEVYSENEEIFRGGGRKRMFLFHFSM